MTHRIRTGICWLIACVALAAVNIQIGFAATSLSPYAGELKGEAPAPAEPAPQRHQYCQQEWKRGNKKCLLEFRIDLWSCMPK